MEPNWGYDGDNGPHHWGQLSERYQLCAEGCAQSPIELASAIPTKLVPIQFDYGKTTLYIFNTGNTIQVNTDPGSSITYNEIPYALQQFHFHHPGEHTINGQRGAMEAHFVHQDLRTGNLAVIAVMLVAGETVHPGYADVLENLPRAPGGQKVPDSAIALSALLPPPGPYYTYAGSLTTPPCSENVRWLVLENTVEISRTQVAAFTTIFSHNARPLQSLNDRDLLYALPSDSTSPTHGQ